MGPWRSGLALVAVACWSRLASCARLPPLEEVIADLDKRGIDGKDFFTSMKYAIDHRDEEFFRGLIKSHLSKGQDTRRLSELQDSVFRLPSYSVLHYACWSSNPKDPDKDKAEHVKVLLDAGMSVDLPTSQNIRPLHIGSAYNKTDVVKVLIERGADPRVFSVSNMSPATMAARSGHLKVLQHFKDAGGDYERMLKERDFVQREPYNKGWTPLMYALNGGHLETVRFLLFEGCFGDAPVSEVQKFMDGLPKVSKELKAQVTALADTKSKPFQKNLAGYYEANPSRKPASAGLTASEEL